MNASFRTASRSELADALTDARDYTLALFERFAEAGLDLPARVPLLSTVNPPLWELGHQAWFAEWYILREAESSQPGTARGHSLLTKGDDWFDSNLVPHKERWSLGLPSPGALKTYCREVLDRVLDKLSRSAESAAALYPYRLALAHEDMHGEALAYTMQTLGVPALPHGSWNTTRAWAQGTIRFPGGTFELGSAHNEFVFDNEKWAHPVRLDSYEMDATLVTNAQYADFVDDNGYENPHYWTQAGRIWLMSQEQSAPRYWRRDNNSWRCERFGRDSILPQHEPVRHVNLYEAQAYCTWAGRRLPTEAEWESAALSRHPALRWGDLWEWTCSRFLPYEGFEADAYREYSQPWFDSHQVLRGASFVTPGRMRSVKFRNFYLPERNDIFVGFRTCGMG
ncbi:selenoneine synthase SenA [Lacisediminimonas profundi]|uniref:selenoneine synthase SenA n=1 Tax=Lacisediminimonas profundi TaxID=2603856 RepID=UPI00188417D6|nr:selenoneine synthase SenA [Lacisediminimonas profundi]